MKVVKTTKSMSKRTITTEKKEDNAKNDKEVIADGETTTKKTCINKKEITENVKEERGSSRNDVGCSQIKKFDIKC